MHVKMKSLGEMSVTCMIVFRSVINKQLTTNRQQSKRKTVQRFGETWKNLPVII